MNRNSLVVACCMALTVLGTSLFAQNLLVPVFFEDAAGNRDTLLAGWHPNATDSLDPALMEVNVIGTPIDTVFDVRFSDEFWQRFMGQPAGTYHSKRQYIGQPCAPSQVPAIDIYCNHWPLRVSWDPIPMQGGCTVNAVYTDVHPGGWFDTGGLFMSCMIADSVIELRQPDYTSDPVQYWYNATSQDTVYSTFMLIGNAEPLSIGFPGCGMVGLNDLGMTGVTCFPNPAQEAVYLQVPAMGYSWKLFTAQGKLLRVGTVEGLETLVDLPVQESRTIYMLYVQDPEGKSSWHKILKQ